MKKLNRKHYKYLFAVITIAISSVVVLLATTEKMEVSFSTSIIELGSISNTITAIGRLEATNTVIVGTQVSGVVQNLYVDFNSNVKKGQLIAELDRATLQSSLENAEADLEKAEATLEYHESSFNRTKTLFEKEMASESDYDLAAFNYKISRAGVKSALANLERAQRDLGYASIYSPIDGVVLNRAVEEGQTVAASMNTPELFTITNHLSTMQVEASVDEADIGYLKTQQRVVFTVDAFPEQIFEGNVAEVRLQPNESSNVITYNAIISVSNPDLKLKPGMTASITIYIEEADDVLLVPVSATSFKPTQQLLSNLEGQNQPEERLPVDRDPNTIPPERTSKTSDSLNVDGNGSPQTVWVQNQDQIYPINILVGIDDGSNMQVLEGLEEGMQVITSVEYTAYSALTGSSGDDDEQKSPFLQETQQGGPGGGGGQRGTGGPPPR